LNRLRSHVAAIVSILLLLSLLLHVFVAGQTHPVAPAIGDRVHPPNRWSNNRVARFRVATYNIHRGKGLDGVRDLKRTAAVLKWADIIGINEAAGPSFFGEPNQVAQLGRMLEMGWLFAANQYRWYHLYFGNGLLSRFEVTRWFNEPLIYNEASGRGLRNLITAQIPLGSKNITVMVTHLDRSPIRDAQLRYVIREFKQYQRVILMGDLNTSIDNPQLQALLEDNTVTDAIDAALGDDRPKAKGDWIITRGFRVLDGGMIPTGVSDHPCFWVDLEID
jgi:endonuclease/exonuclease/phosphatase family metal-dependent hydrolase